MNPDLPYVAEYAKSGRASCKLCKKPIAKDGLRIGVMVQSHNFDAKIPLWHHGHCFLAKRKVPNHSEIGNFDNLRFEDQKTIKEKAGQNVKNGKSVAGEAGTAEFSVEYAKSGRAGCKSCGEKIPKGELRIAKIITDGPDAARFGPTPAWRHVDCFVKDRLELSFTSSADMIPGFENLDKEDQKVMSSKLAELKIKRDIEEVETEERPSKKLMRKEDRVLKAQSDLLYGLIDEMKKSEMSRKEMIALLEHNKQHVSAGDSRLREGLADCLTFGAIKMCPECKSSAPRFKIDQYRCSGNMTEWTKCQYVTRRPERQPFIIPEDFKEKYDFLRDYKFIRRDRYLPTKDEVKPAAEIKQGPLNGFIIALIGKLPSKDALEKKIMELGGAVNSKIDNSVSCCICTEAEFKKLGKKVKKTQDLDIHVVLPQFVEDVEKGISPATALKDNMLSVWGGDPILKFGIKKENSSASSSKDKDKSSSAYTKSLQKVKITVAGGAAVDPESGMQNKCHVYQKKNCIFNVVLGKVDVIQGSNNFYKLQILESNNGQNYWLFRSWGRIGTTIGNKLLEKKASVNDAILTFEDLYLEKTGNYWCNHHKFQKKPGLMFPLDIDYGQQDGEDLQELKAGENSKLPKPVQDLICLIFDIKAMKKAMMEFELDLQKMPLGKLSKKQIESAYSILNEVQQVLMTGSNATKILDASNRFYTLIPHDFGMKAPPLLDNEELIKTKIEMLDSLLEIEFAYSMLKGGTHEASKDPVDEHYEKLSADIEVLDQSSDEYNVIEKYLKNTHADTHRSYELVLNKVFKINRHGENERYQKCKDLSNKKLLWHGSRLTNFVGILSQGLKIAPPEAPATGYMFGKGIYFADMVSKSANYCYTSKKNSTGLLLLCEVALGNMYEKNNAEYVTKLPKNKHSTKGVGMTLPDPNEKTFLEGVEVPYGKPKQNKAASHTALLYNEYIVYDVNQVNIKYLLKVNFKWKY